MSHSNEITEERPTLPEDITPTDFDTYIHTLNTALSPFNYEIRSARPQSASFGSENIYALVNAQSDIQTQLATTHSADEVAFIRRVLDAMFETHNTPEREVMAIKFNAGLALSKPPQTARASVGGGGETQNGGSTQGATAAAANAGIKKDQAEQVLEQLVKDGWFARSRNGYLSLDTRGIMELGGWLVQMYNEEEDPEDVDDDTSRPWQRIKMCEGCKQIITVVSYTPPQYLPFVICQQLMEILQGQRCSESTCMVRLHDPCVTTFFHGQPRKQCPECKNDWTSTSFVGERAAARDGGLDTSGRRGSRR
jgi:hypothetical protein